MPEQPSWIERVPAIFDALRDPHCPPLLDREAIERLMGVSRRQANRIIRSCDVTYKIGRSVVVDRDSLVVAVRHYLDSGAVEVEARRRSRLSECLADARGEALRRRILIPVKEDARGRTFDDLPPGIALAPGLLTVSYASPLELIEKLFELSQAVSNDFARFENLTTRV